jgi:3-oxoacyl-[acyl-carrier-protein] synthase II
MTASSALLPEATAAGTTAVDIVGCGVFSAAGRGLAPIAEAFAFEPAEASTLEPEAGWPPVAVRPLAGFDPAALLGRKGLSRMTRTDQLASAACIDALEDAGPGPAPERTGIVVGTAVGSANAVLDFLRDTFEQPSPYLVNPSHFPGTLMNSAAGKTAIRQRLTGINASVSGGALAGMNALRYAHAMLVEGRAERLVTGGVEELSSLGTWAWHRGQTLAPGAALAEGCAMFALDAPGGEGRVLGRLLACESGFSDPGNGLANVSARLAECVRTALARSGLGAEQVSVVVPGAGGRRGWGAVEERALRQVFAGPETPRLRPHHVLGETYSAGTAMNLAALLAGWQYPWDSSSDDSVAVLTSVGFDGSVGCVVVARPDSA